MESNIYTLPWLQPLRPSTQLRSNCSRGGAECKLQRSSHRPHCLTLNLEIADRLNSLKEFFCGDINSRCRSASTLRRHLRVFGAKRVKFVAAEMVAAARWRCYPVVPANVVSGQLAKDRQSYGRSSETIDGPDSIC